MTDISKQLVVKAVALIILVLSILWKIIDQILIGKSLVNAFEFSIGYLIVFFVISVSIGIIFGLIKRSYSLVYMTFSVMYVLLLFAANVLPLLIFNNLK